MAKRLIGFFKNIRGSADSNLKRGEEVMNNKKAELKEKFEKIKERIPSVKDGLEAIPKKIANKEALQVKVKDLITKYEKFTGMDEIMALQRAVVEAQEKFIGAQEKRREAGTKLLNIQWKLKEIHEDMQNTPKGDQKYLRLVTDEHNAIVEEQHLRKEFLAIEREEREHFNTMSAAVKLSHERERAHADRNKYWYIVASLVGTALGVFGSTLNNRIKMAEFRDMLTEQMERSNTVLLSMGTASPNMVGKTGGALASTGDLSLNQQRLRDIEMRVAAIANNQGTILEHMRKSENYVNIQLEDIKKLVNLASAAHVKSDKALKEAIRKARIPLPNQESSSTTHELLDKISENEELLKKSLFAAIVLLVLYGIIGKMS